MKSKLPCLFLLVIISLLGAGCEKTITMRIQGSVFSLELWSNWKFIEGQGFDTHVGVFTDGVNDIHFDYGYFAGVNLNAIQPDSNYLYYEETVIDGAPAKIFKINKEGKSYLNLYIQKVESDSAKLWIEDPDDDERYIAIFKSFRFL